MTPYYLAVDIGASGGRHILGTLMDGKMVLEEVYRFRNGMVDDKGVLCWNLENLFREIVNGLKRCRETGKIPGYMGIDTWAVDFVLLDEHDRIIGKTAAYRDSRTENMDKKVYEIISREALYQRTGIQKQIFNTIFQLMAIKEKQPEDMDKARVMLMIPDYFNFLLTGIKRAEYTNATTTQLVSPLSKEWDYELIEKLGFKKELFRRISAPGTLIGWFKQRIVDEAGFNCQVILPATHDTASAVLAVPVEDDEVLYISSGTWSLMGTERIEADCSKRSMDANFTNEGGYGYRFRYLKNIMGLWMVQSVIKEFEQPYSFSDLCSMASKEKIASIVDCNSRIFLAPDSMIMAVQEFCRNTRQQVPETTGEITAVIYNSLAKCYNDTLKEIQAITGRDYGKIHIVGGGTHAGYLNELTSKYTGKVVLAGPAEATAIGNLTAQMLYRGDISDIRMARRMIRKSFKIKVYGSKIEHEEENHEL